MSIMQRITLIGMYNYNASLFDNLDLPAGYDKDVFIETLLLEHGEKCVLYSDFEFMRYTVGVLSRKWRLELERIYEALTAEYNPIYNYDRYEESTDGRGKKWGEKDQANYDTKLTRNTTDTRTPTLTELTEHGKTETSEQLKAGYTEQKTNGFTEQKTNGYTEQKTDGHTKQVTNGYTDQVTAGYSEQDTGHKAETEELVAAYNSSTYEPSKKTITDSGKLSTSTGKIENSVGQVDTSQGKIETSQGKIENSQGKIENDSGKTEIKFSGKDRVETRGTDSMSHTGDDTTNVKGTLSDKVGNETENATHKAHLYGNIGVTTSAQMVREVVRDRIEISLYSTAAQIFANEMLLMIY